jgi:DNA-binding PadR family transcriptional regulator
MRLACLVQDLERRAIGEFLDLVVLHVLSKENLGQNAYQVVQKIKERTGFLVTQKIYNVLKQLELDGFLVGAGGRKTYSYCITKKGRVALEELVLTADPTIRALLEVLKIG